MKRFAFPICVAALIGAFLFWWFSPVQVVKRRTGALLETLTMQAATGKAARQAGVYSLNALLASEVELESPAIPEANGTFDRSEMESAFSWLAEQAKQTRFELERIDEVTVTEDHARVSFLIEALVELPEARPVDGRYAVVFDWRRGQAGWRLERARWDEASP